MGNKDKATGGKGTEEEMFMTVGEVAKKMNVSQSTAYEFIKSGNCGFKYVTVGKKSIRIPKKGFCIWYDNLCE